MTSISTKKVVLLKNSIYNINTIQFSTNLGTSWSDITSWPVSIETNKIKLETNLTFSPNTTGSIQSGKDLYFIVKKNLNLVGNANIVNINNIDNYPGFIQNGTIAEQSYNLDINNLGIESSNSTLFSDTITNTGSGWLIHSYLNYYLDPSLNENEKSKDRGKGKTTITNCYVWGNIDKKNTGGFIGSNCGKNVVINGSYLYSSIHLDNSDNSDNLDGFYGLNNNPSNKINNSYFANGLGSWSDLEASSKLKGSPEYNLDGTQRTNGILWSQNSIQTPYVLKNNSNSNSNSNLKLSSCSDYSIIKNILLIDNTVIQNEQFFNSVNSDTLGIIYNLNSTSTELVNFLKTNFTQIDRIGFVFNNTNIMSKQFLDNKYFFVNDDLLSIDSSKPNYSSNVELVLWICSTFNIRNIDYLACESLKYNNWKDYFNLLNKQTGVIVGASDDLTGNVKYGGDWVLESTGEDIEKIYWTNQIQNYTGLLGTQLILSYEPGTLYFRQSDPIAPIEYQYDSTSGPWTEIDLGTDEWPITIINSNPVGGILTVSFFTDITINDETVVFGPNGYFIAGSEKITFEGNLNNITIENVTDYFGLIHNGNNPKSGYSNIIIQNINVKVIVSTLASNGGWIGQTGFGFNAIGCEINNCTTDGDLLQIQSGYIVGSYSANCTGSLYSSSLTINNCSSTGEISDSYTGGIFGLFAGSNYGSATATDCSSTGNISGNSAGGIFGLYAGENYGSAIATNCSSTGEIAGYYAGGIFGEYAGYNSGSATATNCSSIGDISGNFAGGIFGTEAGSYNGSATATNCSSTGQIYGNTSGGIFGYYAGGNYGSATAYNCSSIGEISGSNVGGIFGNEASGYFAYGGSAIATNCYTQGSVTGTNSYGIFGPGVVTPSTRTATNCYYNTTGSTLDVVFTNCYCYNGLWDDLDAITNLDNTTTPTYIGSTLSNPIGTVWADPDASNSNVPYIFSSFGSSPYTTPSASLDPGQTSQTANVTTGVSYNIIAISNSPPVVPSVYPFITISNSTGAISVGTSGVNPGTYTIYVYQLNNNKLYTVTTFILTITGSSPPVIIIQPESKTVNLNSLVNFNVVAIGTEPLSYQWYKNNSVITGANLSTYTISSVKLSNAGTYWVIVTNIAGHVQSSNAILTINGGYIINNKPLIYQQPRSQLVKPKTQVIFNVFVFSLTSVTYQWFFNDLPIKDATNSDYIIKSVKRKNVGKYFVIVTNIYGSTKSENAYLTIDNYFSRYN